MSKRAVLYARVSGDDRGKDDRNLTGQIEMARELALRREYVIVAELTEDDRGASGASFELEQLNKVREMAGKGEFDILVVREIDRLSRSLAKQLIVEEELKRAGVTIEYVLGEYADTPEGNLMKNIRATIAEYERLKISERNTRGRRLKVKDGNVLTHGKAPYGYELGKGENGKSTLIVYEPEAQIVRLIYRWYTEGDGERRDFSQGSIADKLTELGVPTAKDTAWRKWGSAKKRGYGQWGSASVAKILKNPTYMGVWVYGKKARKNGKWISNPSDNFMSLTVPAIVDEDTWRKVEKRRQQNILESKRNRKNNYLLGKRVVCGLCEHRMAGGTVKAHGRTYLYYSCPNARNKLSEVIHPCKMPLFPVKLVDELIWRKVVEFLMAPDALREGFESYRENSEKKTAPLRERLRVVGDLLVDNRGQLNRLLDLYLTGNFPKEMLLDRQKRLETTISALEREQASLLDGIKQGSLSEEQIQSIETFAAEISSRLLGGAQDFNARREIIEALNVEVTLTIEAGEKIAYLRMLHDSASQLRLPIQPPLLGVESTTFRDEPGHTRLRPCR